MRKIPCFIYREGEHFVFPEQLLGIKRSINEFCALDESGRIIPNPEVFTNEENPSKAELFLFPFEVGQYIDSGHFELLSALISSLPCLKECAARHIVLDTGDST